MIIHKTTIENLMAEFPDLKMTYNKWGQLNQVVRSNKTKSCSNCFFVYHSRISEHCYSCVDKQPHPNWRNFYSTAQVF